MQTQVELSVKQQKQTARRKILEYTIEEDQDALLQRWAQTLIHVCTDDHPADKTHLRAVRIMVVAMAAVAKGGFVTSKSGQNDAFNSPANALCVADYLSHASRVMIDLSELSEKNKKLFLNQFPIDELDARPSSHRTQRKDGILTEEKTILHGVKGTILNGVDALGETTGIGQLAAKVGIKGPELTDFGVDIQMGGVNQRNLSGGVSARGRDGHILIHLGDPNAVMIGLEQTKPVSNQDMQDFIGKAREVAVGAFQTLVSFVSRQPSPPDSPNRKTPSPSLEHDDDNTCGLSGEHSMLGHSDDYTAAGSLYFSNLIYKLKLLEEKGALTPAKYNGMRVNLNNSNFSEFGKYSKALFSAHKKQDAEAIKKLLQQSPSTALPGLSIEDKENNSLFLVKNISQSDVSALFKQLNDVYGEEGIDKPLFEQKLEDMQAWLAEPRRLPKNNRVINTFHDNEISSTNPHVKRLEKTLNQVVMILKQRATAELTQQQTQPSDVIQQMQLLEQAYNGIALNEECPIYQRFKKLREEFNTLCDGIRGAKVDDPAFPFGYLIQLQQLEDNIALFVGTNESRALIHLMKNATVLRVSNDALMQQLQAERADKVEGLARLEEIIRTTQAELALIQHPLPPIDTIHNDAEEDAPLNHENAHKNVLPEYEEPIWDWAFVWQCMSSHAAFNTYGTVLIVASLIIAGTAATGVIPVALVTTAALSGLALSAACFFYARSVRQDDMAEPLAGSSLGRQV